MNIQFMTAEANGIPSRFGEVDWKGDPRCTYIPNFDLMLRNATCEEEKQAIRKAREITGVWDDGFAFEIVYTAVAKHVDPWTGETSRTWQVLQHPWYSENGVKKSKEYMIAEIEKFNANI